MDANAPAESSRIPELQQAIVGTGWQTHLGGIAKVAGSLVKKALNGDTTSAIFYLKTQAGWKETSDLNLNMNRPVEINLSRKSSG